ncbi:MAG: hypothetical protein LLF94_06295 [Chlamydiales bacterium]|nr:hypothetical protein [Chlamydiales bacterium]
MSSQNISNELPNWLREPLAAGAAIVPTYYGFRVKTAQQLGQPIPKMGFGEAVRGGVSLSPTVASLVGMQMMVQKVAEEKIQELTGRDQGFLSTAASSLAVGLASSPGIAVFNGQAAGQSPLVSLRNLTPRQFGAISAQETAFVMGLSAAKHINALAKEQFGESLAVETSSSFISGAIGSLCGHPANTCLTRWQNGLKVESAGQLMRGGSAKALATGVFSAVYHATSKYMQ